MCKACVLYNSSPNAILEKNIRRLKKDRERKEANRRISGIAKLFCRLQEMGWEEVMVSATLYIYQHPQNVILLYNAELGNSNKSYL